MKKFIKISITVVVIIITTLFIINQFTMKSIKTEIIINASTGKVWNTLMNYKEYVQWNPFILQISGQTDVGGELNVTIQNGENKTMSFKPTILVNNANNEFRWRGKLFVEGLFDGEHYFILEQIDANKTKLIHGEEFTGLLSGALFKMIAKDTERGFREMNSALKKQIETQNK